MCKYTPKAVSAEPPSICVLLMPRSHIHGLDAGLARDVHSWQSVLVRSFPHCIRNHYGRPWPAVNIIFVQITHQIQVLTEPLCRAQAILYALPNNERGTKYRGLTYSARQNCP